MILLYLAPFILPVLLSFVFVKMNRSFDKRVYNKQFAKMQTETKQLESAKAEIVSPEDVVNHIPTTCLAPETEDGFIFNTDLVPLTLRVKLSAVMQAVRHIQELEIWQSTSDEFPAFERFNLVEIANKFFNSFNEFYEMREIEQKMIVSRQMIGDGRRHSYYDTEFKQVFDEYLTTDKSAASLMDLIGYPKHLYKAFLDSIERDNWPKNRETKEKVSRFKFFNKEAETIERLVKTFDVTSWDELLSVKAELKEKGQAMKVEINQMVSDSFDDISESLWMYAKKLDNLQQQWEESKEKDRQRIEDQKRQIKEEKRLELEAARRNHQFIKFDEESRSLREAAEMMDASSEALRKVS